jgi:hypothetical protein
MNFQPPDGYTTEELAEFANTLPATPEEAYAEGRKDQREDDMRLLNWAYSKLQHFHFTAQEDALAMDEIKLMQMGAA